MDYGQTRIWTIVLKITNQCTASCAHCSVRSGPESKEHLEWQLAENALLSAPDVGCDTVWVSGGEPFLRFQDLRRIVELAPELGLRVIINSNAYWATSKDQGFRTLHRMLKWGTFELALSSDDFHLPYVGFDRVENAACAASELGITRWLGWVTHSGDASRRTMLERAARIDLPVTEQPLQYIGRARELVQIQTTDMQQHYDPCSIVIVPTVLVDGRVSLCCTGAASENPRLIVGDLKQESFREIVRRMQVDPVQNVLRVGGPGLLWKLASSEGARAPSYQSKCQFCREVCQTSGLDDRIKQRATDEFLSKLISIDVLQRAKTRATA